MSTIGDTSQTSLKNILEALLLASGEPLTVSAMAAVFSDEERPSADTIARELEQLAEDYLDRGLELKEVASGFRLQVRQEVTPWISRLWQERPKRYSRALLETMALIAYRQPITRGDIEEVRGVSVSSSIIRTLQEREWIRVVGHRDVPGKPALFGTTRAFLDYFDIKSLDDLPSLAEIRDMDSLEPELDFDSVQEDISPGESEQSAENPEAEADNSDSVTVRSEADTDNIGPEADDSQSKAVDSPAEAEKSEVRVEYETDEK
jgi:segregation and condensation protein B